MDNQEIRIRTASLQDAKELLEIYRPYVEHTAITFEYTPPTEEKFAGRIRGVLSKYPYLVAEGKGKILGYAYVSSFKEREAYDWAVENGYQFVDLNAVPTRTLSARVLTPEGETLTDGFTVNWYEAGGTTPARPGPVCGREPI